MKTSTQGSSSATKTTTKTTVAAAKAQQTQAQSLYNHGKNEYIQGRYSQAANSFQQAIQIQEAVLGKYHRHTIKSYWRYGKAVCLSKKNADQALRAFLRVGRMAETSFDANVNQQLWEEMTACWQQGYVHNNSNHDTTVDSALEQIVETLCLEREADSKCKQELFDEAIPLYQQALAIQDTLLEGKGDDCLDGADIRCKLACCFLRIGKLYQAMENLDTAHGCYVQHFGHQHPATLGATASIQRVNQGARDDFASKRQGSGHLSTAIASMTSKNKKNRSRH